MIYNIIFLIYLRREAEAKCLCSSPDLEAKVGNNSISYFFVPYPYTLSLVDILPSAWAREGCLNLQAVSTTHFAFIISNARYSTYEILSVATSIL